MKSVPDVAQDASAQHQELQENGFTILRKVLSPENCQRWASEIAIAFEIDSCNAISGNAKRLVGGRNLQAVWSSWQEPVCANPLFDFLALELSESFEGSKSGFGLVRILFFDKPPGQTWNLSPHQDKTIAVDGHHETASPYGKPTTKAGVAHVEADENLLKQMVTLRFHLDEMHSGNGPLTVMPGTHRKLSHTAMLRSESGVSSTPIEVHCDAGDVFVMKPLLLHGSRSSHPDCTDNRRVVHLEFAPREVLAAPYRWHQYDEVEMKPQ